MFSYLFREFSRERAKKALMLGVSSTVLLYFLLIAIAEPLRAFGATTADMVVQFVVTGSLSMSCSATSTLGSAVGTGTSGTGALATAYCQPSTNNSLGYTLTWIVQTGSGAPAVHANCTSITPCYGTGHLLSNNVTSGYPDIIRSIRLGTTTATHWDTNARRIDSTTVPSGSGARWGARLMASSTTPAGATVTWGADTDETMGFLAVNTGAAVNIAKRNNPTSGAGDLQNFLFKVFIPSGSFQPTGTYKATIRFTVTDN